MDQPISTLQDQTQHHIWTLSPILARAAAGDFTQNVPIPDHEDEFTGLYVGIQLLFDVIREKVAVYEKANYELQQQVEEKAALLQSIGDGVVMLDQQGLVTYINPAANSLLGWDATELVGKNWTETIKLERSDKTPVPPQERPLSVSLQVRSESVIETTTYYFVRKDGSRFAVQTTVTPVKVAGQQVGSVIIFHDVTKEKAVAELKEDFLSLATHQLRSPLTTMLWTLDLLLKDSSELTPELRQKLEMLNRNTKTLIELVQDVLSVTRIGQDILKEQKAVHNIVTLLKQIVEQSRPEASNDQISLDLQVNESALNQTEYLLDARLFTQCIQNLITNAIRYSKPGGSVEIDAQIRDEQLCIDVKDHGIGIPEKDQPHLFEKFYRGENIPIEKIPGSGLGLFIVQSLAKRWNGTITFTSQENVGSTFSLCVPLGVWKV